jgi:CheY-like chemotaxis protein
MNTSFSIRSIDNPLNIHNTNSLNELEQAVQVFIQTQFTGCLSITVRGRKSFQGNLFFNSGRLFGGDSSFHPVRRWYRQVTQNCSQLSAPLVLRQISKSQHWTHTSLIELITQGRITNKQLSAIMEGNLTEILFDINQAAGKVNAEMQLTCNPLSPDLLLPAAAFVPIRPIYEQVQQLWQDWQAAELTEWSPNLAFVVWDPDELQKQTSFTAFHNLTLLADGDRTLRDIAIQLKQPLIPLTRSLIPYIQRGIIGLTQVPDWSSDRLSSPNRSSPPPAAAPAFRRSTQPLITYIEDSGFDSIAMSEIVTQAGYRYINVRNPIEALPALLEQKPSLIFLDLLMPVTNGYEVCAQIRRVSALKDTPIIIVTSKDGIVDRVRAKLAGSSGFIAKPIDRDKVLNVLGNYLTNS